MSTKMTIPELKALLKAIYKKRAEIRCDECGDITFVTFEDGTTLDRHDLLKSLSCYFSAPVLLTTDKNELTLSFDGDDIGDVCRKILNMDNTDALSARLMSTFDRQYNTDDEPSRKKGYALMREYLCGNLLTRQAIDSTLMILCGWTMGSLLALAKLKDDTNGICDGTKADYSTTKEDEEWL